MVCTVIFPFVILDVSSQLGQPLCPWGVADRAQAGNTREPLPWLLSESRVWAYMSPSTMEHGF